jgi:hypothetical protein
VQRITYVVGALAIGALAGCGGSSGTPTTATTAAATPTPAHVSHHPRPTPTAATDSTALAPSATYFGYIKTIDADHNKLTFDRALFYTGDDANKEAAARGDETPVPNDYYIVNDNPLLRTLPLSLDVVVSESIEIRNAIGKNDFNGHNITGPLSDLTLAFANQPGSLTHTPFFLHLDGAGAIDKIREQFVP